jgi:hypothetical protein
MSGSGPVILRNAVSWPDPAAGAACTQDGSSGEAASISSQQEEDPIPQYVDTPGGGA